MNANLKYNDCKFIIDRQNEQEIQQHLILGDTYGYNPCLAILFSKNQDIILTFLRSFSQWYPNICRNITTDDYLNEYVFDGGKSITLNNLIINDNINYPFVRSMDNYDATISCNFCNISAINMSLSSNPLFFSYSNIKISNSYFSNIQLTTNAIFMAYGDAYSSDNSTRSSNIPIEKSQMSTL